MAGPEDILVRIAVSGQGDVISALGSIGQAGESAFARLEDSLGTFGKVAGGLVASITGIGVGLFTLAESSANSTRELRNLATASGISVENLSGMQGALASMGLNTDTLGMSFRRLSMTIEREWDAIQKAVKDRSDQVIDDQLAVNSSTLSVGKAQDSLFQAQEKLKSVQRSQGYNAPAATPQMQAYQQLLSAQHAEQEAENSLAEARQKAAEALKKQTEDNLNDLTNITKAIDEVAGGYAKLQDVKGTATLSVENVVKGLVISSAGAGAESAIKNFNGDIASLAKMAPDVESTFLKIADFMKNSGDAALNSALSFRLFGRNAGELTSILTQLGGSGLKDLADKFKTLGFATSDADVDIGKKFSLTLGTLRYELVQLKEQLGAVFEKDFIEGLATFQKFIENNRAAIVDWAKDLATNIKPAILDFFNLISGEKATNTTWMQPLANGIKKVGEVILDTTKALGALFIGLTGGDKSSMTEKWLQQWVTLGDVVGKVINGVIANLQKLYGYVEQGVQVINSSLGTSFTTAGVIAGIAILKLTGTLGTLSTALVAITAVGKTAWAAIAGEGVAAGAGGAVAGAAAGAAGVAAKAEAKIAPTVGRNAAGQFTKLAAGAAEGGGLAAGVAFIRGIGAALVSAGAIAIVGGAIGALIVAAALWAKNNQDKKDEDYRKGRAEYTPGTLTLNEQGEQVIQSKDEFEKVQEENREKERVRRLDESTQRPTGLNTRFLEGQQTSPTGEAAPRSTALSRDQQNAKLDELLGLARNPERDQRIADAERLKTQSGVAPPSGRIGQVQDQGGYTMSGGQVQAPGGEIMSLERALKEAGDRAEQGARPPQSNTLGNVRDEFGKPLERGQPFDAEDLKAAGVKAKDAITSGADNLEQALQTGGVKAKEGTDAIEQALQTGAASVTSALGSLTDSINAGKPAAPQGHATGGLISGSGSGTSDSNLALVSNHEYVHTAKAVEHYGVPFMDAINQMKLPKSSIGGLVNWASNFQLPKFATGGHVNWDMGSLIDSLDTPRFASGGSVAMASPSRSSTEHFGSVDLRTDHGTFRMNTSNDTMKDLSRAAVDRKLRSGGVPPSHVR